MIACANADMDCRYLPSTNDVGDFLPYLVPVVVARLGRIVLLESSYLKFWLIDQ